LRRKKVSFFRKAGVRLLGFFGWCVGLVLALPVLAAVACCGCCLLLLAMLATATLCRTAFDLLAFLLDLVEEGSRFLEGSFLEAGLTDSSSSSESLW
jgi:hypothetical protein